MSHHTYRALTLSPYAITDKNGEILDEHTIMQELRNDITNAQALAQWEIDNNGDQIIQELKKDENLTKGSVNTTADKIGLKIPLELDKTITTGKSGKSRYKSIVYGEVIASARSWITRIHATQNTGKAYISQGFKRTARGTKPRMPYRLNTGYTSGGQYAQWDKEKRGTLHLVINGTWRVLHFKIPEKITGYLSLPTISLTKENRIVFQISEKTPYQQSPISTRYFVGVDVGKVQYATVSIWDNKEKRIVLHTTLSQRVHSLWNSIQASEKQKNHLRDKGLFNEARYHRDAASRKKRELAILAAQEVACIAHGYENAVVMVEDLSWIVNTMANGRWNRGEFVSWLSHYVEQNGSRVLKVNARNTSRSCHKCGSTVVFDKRMVLCSCGLFEDRDVNASAVIAQRGVSSVVKMSDTRQKAKSYSSRKSVRKSPVARSSLKYPGRDRSKNTPTPRRKTRKTKSMREVSKIMSPSRQLLLDNRVREDSETTMTLRPFTGDSFYNRVNRL